MGQTRHVLIGLLCAGCEVVELGATQQPIVNGDPDTVHDAVVALFDSATSSQCTGTIIAATGATGVVLTAAHCLPVDVVVMGDDYSDPSAVVWSVTDSLAHPLFSPTDPGAGYDFALVRFAGSGVIPVIPAMSPAEDQLTAGTQLLEVGFGVTAATGGYNTIRRQFLGTIADLDSRSLRFSNTTGGPCSGDSGGPSLSGGTERVAGVVSYGDVTCTTFSAQGRVSAVYDGFILPYLDGTPPVDAAPAVPDAAPSPDAGNPADGDGDGGGCCGVAGGDGPRSLWIAALVALVLRRRGRPR